MSLPIPWVEKIFRKLIVTYGRDFLGRYEGLDIEDVKADWAHELRGFQQNPAALAYGLETCLGGKPPTVQDFKLACNRRPDTTLALPSPPADPERMAAELAKLSPLRKTGATFPVDHKAWARRLKARHDAGEKLNPNQVRCYTAALCLDA